MRGRVIGRREDGIQGRNAFLRYEGRETAFIGRKEEAVAAVAVAAVASFVLDMLRFLPPSFFTSAKDMYCNAPALIVTLFGLLGLGIIFSFDPTHDYPTASSNITLQPGEEVAVDVPTTMTGFLKWAGRLISDPYLWAAISSGEVDIANYTKQLSPGVHVGMPAARVGNVSKGKAIVRNIGNATINTVVSFTMAPTPDKLGDAKAWWYVIFGFLQAMIGGVVATVPPGQQGAGAASSSSTATAGGPSFLTRLKERLSSVIAKLRRKKVSSTAMSTVALSGTILPPRPVVEEV